jgi:hypothetical protein
MIGLVLGAACPLLSFVLFWWTTAAFSLFMADIPVRVIIMAALTGLVVGIVLDIVFIRRWVKGFYTANVSLLIVVYLGLCVVAIAFFMGLPVGTFALGIAVSAYAGRRQRHMQTHGTSVTTALHKAAFLAAFVTTATAFPIGILALDEQSVLKFLEAIFGFDQAIFRGPVGLAMVVFLCLVLFLGQYWCSRQAGQLTFRIDSDHAQQGTGADA